MIRLAVGLRRSPRPAGVLAGNVVDRFLDVMAQAGLVLLGLILLPSSVPGNLQETARKGLLVCIAGIVSRWPSQLCFLRAGALDRPLGAVSPSAGTIAACAPKRFAPPAHTDVWAGLPVPSSRQHS